MKNTLISVYRLSDYGMQCRLRLREQVHASNPSSHAALRARDLHQRKTKKTFPSGMANDKWLMLVFCRRQMFIFETS